MIGNEKHAATVAAFDFGIDEWDDATRVPEGFTLLATGGYRVAVLGPDGVVYKRELDEIINGDEAFCNRREAETFAKWGHKTVGLKLAACTLYGEILAMEYVVSDTRPVPEVRIKRMETFCRNMGWYDVVGKLDRNWFTVKGMPVLVDYSV